MHRTPIEILAEKYLNNKTTISETQKVLAWFKTEAGKKFLDEHLDADIRQLDEQKILFNKKINTAKILGHIYEAETTKPVLRTRRYGFAYKVAASILVTVIAFLIYWTQEDYIIYATNPGEKREIILPDQSHVVLNGNSSIKIAKDWSDNQDREVWLNGEAFFTVVHTHNHSKFSVHTSTDFNIQVLGTEFNVNNREQVTKVVLQQGKINLNIRKQGKESTVTMKPGEFVEFDQRSSYLIKRQTKVELITSWKEDKMVFEEITVGEIAAMLEHTYGLKLIINDPSIIDQKITGTVPAKNIDLFLQGLATILDVDIKREEGFIYLNKTIPDK
jgi:transmembrane sensor